MSCDNYMAEVVCSNSIYNTHIHTIEHFSIGHEVNSNEETNKGTHGRK